MSFLKGKTLTLVSKGENVRVEWKQGSFLGVGGDRSQNYYLCKYSMDGTDIPVYVQASYTIKSRLTVDSSLQYGMQEGILFFVYHDKSQTIYQHRFRTNTLQKIGYGLNAALKKYRGYDASWIAGDYLRDI